MRVCVPVCASNLAALEEASQRALEWADIVELRIDCLEVAELVGNQSFPAILTFRPAEQGGYRILTREQREAFWKAEAKLAWASFCDIELDLATEPPFQFDWFRTIVSHHDFTGVPVDLEQIYERLAATPANVLKVAVRANDIVDCLPVFRLLDRGRSEGRNVIAIAMGNAGIATRVLGPARGAFLTYGSLEDESATAPGQINARQLRSLYRIDRINAETMICGLVGMPVMHSVSPHMHNAAFAAEEIDGVYLPLEVRDVEAFFKRMVHPRTRELDWKLRGLSVTAPHKSAVMARLDWIDAEAKSIGAVNTVVVESDRLLGYNTDARGLVEPLWPLFDSLAGLRVAVIGAGGAARAAVWGLKQHGARVTIFARDSVKARSLANEFDVSGESLSPASFAGYDLVINATPLGSGEFSEQSPASVEQLAGARVAYDLIYNPPETRFLQQAHEAGCETLGGLAMLVAQARIQFELWTGKKPSAAIMNDVAIANCRLPIAD